MLNEIIEDKYVEYKYFPLENDYYANDEIGSLTTFSFNLAKVSQCTIGVTESLVPFVLRSLLYSIAQRFIWSFEFHNSLLVKASDLCVGILGICLAWQNYSDERQLFALLVYFCISSTTIFLFGQSALCGHLCSIVSVLYTVICQVFVFDSLTFTSFRGALIIASMKQISLAYDQHRSPVFSSNLSPKTNLLKNLSFFKNRTLTGVLAMFAFVFNPAALLFGPFLTYQQYCNARFAFRFSFLFGKRLNSLVTCVFEAAKYLAMSIFFVFYSSCVVDQLPDLISEIFSYFVDYDKESRSAHYFQLFLIGFSVAQSFRFSHYFVSCFATTTSILAGYQISSNKTEHTDKIIETTDWKVIEWPHSVLNVVVYWNLPMHNFLHMYVFKKTYGLIGYFGAMLFTFCASAFLHGLNFQLSAVLVSLAFYAYAEAAFRSRIAKRLNACIKARQCATDCLHLYKNTSFLAISLNLAFVFLNIYHLAYLGAPFGVSSIDNDEDIAAIGYNWHHTLSVWQSAPWHFSSHLIAVFTLFVSYFI